MPGTKERAYLFRRHEKMMLTMLMTLMLGRADAALSDSTQDMALGSDGTILSVSLHATGESLITGPTAFSSVKINGQNYDATSVTGDPTDLTVTYGSSGVTAHYRVDTKGHGISFHVTNVTGNPDELTILKVPYKKFGSDGSLMAIRLGATDSAMVMNGSANVKPEIKDGALACTTYKEYGLTGTAVMIAAPAGDFWPLMHQAEIDNNVPSAKVDGQWSKGADATNQGYLFTDAGIGETDEAISYAKHGGLGAVMIMMSAWAKSGGTYDINTTKFPGGEGDIKAMADRVHNAGLKFGLHFLAPVVTFNDPLYNKGIHKGLVITGNGVLSNSIDSTSGTLSLGSFSPNGPTAKALAPGDRIAIGDELMTVRTVSGMSVNVARGTNNTPKSGHNVGEQADRIATMGGGGIVDLSTSYRDIVADNLARIVRDTGTDMVYFDGSELTTVEGPLWATAGILPVETWSRVGRDLMVMGSAVTPWGWHVMARGTDDDYAAINPSGFLDTRKVQAMTYYRINGLPSEFGWWAILPPGADHPATTIQDIDHLGTRMVAYNSPVGIESTMAELRENKRSVELLERLKTYDTVRQTNVDLALRNNLKTGEWQLVNGQFVAGNQPTIVRAGNSSMTTVNAMAVDRSPGFRLEPANEPDANGTDNNLMRSTSLSNPPGSYAGVIAATQRFSPPRDLSTTPALVMGVDVNGLPSGSDAILNAQLLASDGMMRDYAFKITANGHSDLAAAEPTTFDNSDQDHPAPDPKGYLLKHAVYRFNYKSVISVTFRWMRAPAQGTNVTVTNLDALSSRTMPLNSPTVIIGNTSWQLPITLQPGYYAEWDGRSSQAAYYQKDGTLVSHFAVPQALLTGQGANPTVQVQANGAYKLTIL